MSRHVEELLRQGIDQAAARTEAGAATRLLHRARQHNRRRRQAIAAALAAGTAAVTAAAVIAASTGTPQAGALHGRTITYVTTRAERALAALDQANAVQEVTDTARHGDFGFVVLNAPGQGVMGSGVDHGALTKLHVASEVSWSYRDLYVQQGYGTGGQLLFTSTLGPHGEDGVVYPARIRWHNTSVNDSGSGSPVLSCALSDSGVATGLPNWRQVISKALSCHQFTLGTSQLIRGVDTIELIGRPQQFGTQSMRENLWVDPKSYLPLRMSVTFTDQRDQGVSVLVHDFRWLSPTPANLARLHTAEQGRPVPASFPFLPAAYLPLLQFNSLR